MLSQVAFSLIVKFSHGHCWRVFDRGVTQSVSNGCEKFRRGYYWARLLDARDVASWVLVSGLSIKDSTES